MPVQKFRDSDEARRALAISSDDPRLTERIRALWSFSSLLAPPPPIHRGIHKYRTIEEANAARREWEGDHVRRIAEQRKRER